MLTLSGDFHYSADGTVLPGDFYLKVFPVKGFGIHAGMRTDLSWWAGIQFDFAHFGLGVSGAMDGRQRFAGMTYQLRASLRKYPAIYEGGNKVVVVRVNESLRAKTFFNFDPLGLSRRTFIDLIADINRAERDKSVGALLVKIEDSPLDLEEAEEIVRALERFKARGGRVFAYMDGGGNAEYLLASAAEAVFLNPAGVLLVGGLKAELTFFKGTLQKLDVKMQTIRAGKYKSFVEKFTRENASPENLEQLQAFIGDLNSEMAAQIAKGRRIEPAAVKELIDRGLFTAKEALEVKLVDAIAHEADLEKELEKRLGFSASLNEKYFSIQDRAVAWVAPPKIAVLRIEGSIVYGEGSPPFFGFGTTGSRDVCDAAREIEKSPFYKAVVLRIDSPGGSGLASEIMWKCISDLAAKKPVVVSMGSAAASGGYYTALPAAYIYADPFTLTGSIGVWGLKPNITGLALLLGITHQTVKLTKGADLYSLWRDLDDEEMARVQRYIDGFYEQFKARVSDGRKLKIDEVEKVAQGRVWSAKAALDAKLIDGIGGFEDALAKAKTLSGMDPKKPARLVEFPERPSILRTLKKRFMAVMDPVGAIRKELKDLGSPDASAELPYDVEIK
jgi:protease-4